MDPSSYANTDEARVASFHLQLEANFEDHILHGHVDLNVEVVKDGASQVTFDTRDLSIKDVSVVKGEPLQFKHGEGNEAFGAPLTVTLPESARKAGEKVVIRIAYATSPKSTAIQWLPPSQTAGKKHPYLFTQCQAIHARAMLPCQDTPGVKAPYTASITVPAPLVALMSALQNGSVETGDGLISYNFNQPVPMPSYLVALGVGALEKREIGPRSAVWSEKEMVEAGAYEFADTEKFIKAAEDIVGPYVWGRYDILLLPPSFPYGGMENPCLTFVTPTLLAGDRSLANVVAHEIAHSWMGNLVSPTTWEHFWMNEGFTVFLERKIQRAVFGDASMHLHAIIGWKALRESVEHFGNDHAYTALVPELKDVDPDDAFSSVPYEKGFNFLFYLEKLVGGPEKMNPFLRAHCDKYKFKNTDSYQWKQFFLDYFKDKVDQATLDQIDWDTWYKSPGLPPTPDFDQTLVNNANKFASDVIDGKTEVTGKEMEGWEATQTIAFLEKVQDLQEEKLKADGADKDALAANLRKLDAAYKLTASKNAEIRFRWYVIGIRSDLEEVFSVAAQFLTEVGRMKFVRPLYRTLFKSPRGKQLAIDTFKANRSIYHNICQKMVAKDLGL